MAFDYGNANKEQKLAISTTEGPLLIIAGPGTGKTYTLVKRIVYLITEKNVKPRPGSYIGTVPHDRDIVCDTLDLIHLVGYVYHCNTLITKVIHDTEECFYLIIGKR